MRLAAQFFAEALASTRPMPVRHLHILTTTGDSVADLQASAVASSRLRLGVAAKAFLQQGQSVSVGDPAPGDTRHLLVGKIGAADVEVRSKSWLRQIAQIKKSSGTVLLDYTDHHLAAHSPMTAFYQQATHLADRIIVPNEALQNALSFEYSIQAEIVVVDDALEFQPVKPKKNRLQEDKINVLWFGHPSNAHFLCEFLEVWPKSETPAELLIVSSQPTLETLAAYRFRKAPPIDIKFMPWSPKNLPQAAKQSDLTIIPSSVHSDKKFVSNNRLVTALALGLPTLATPLPSYQEFTEFFSPLSPDNLLTLINDPDSNTESISRFQDEYLPRFAGKSLIDRWAMVLR